MRVKRAVLIVVVVAAAVVTADLLVEPADSPETGPYLNAEPAADAPDNAVVKQYERLSPAHQDAFDRAVSNDSGVPLDGRADVDVWYETEFVRHDGELYRILVAEL
jgi:hypothetical protein